MSDSTPPGLKIKKNLEVINCTPLLKLKTMQILGNAENQLIKAILNHYEQCVPKLEVNIREIYENMTGVNVDEKRLIFLKLQAYKNGLMRQQKNKEDRWQNRNTRNTPATNENRGPNGNRDIRNPPDNTGNQDTQDEPTPGTSTQDPNYFPWDQRPQRPRGRGRGRYQTQGYNRGGRGRGPRENRLEI